MNGESVYVGVATLGAEVAYAVARPRWSLYDAGRKQRGEWRTDVLSIRRIPRAAFVGWLVRSMGDAGAPLGASPRRTLLLDTSEVGAGGLLLRSVQRAVDRTPVLRPLRVFALDVTQRDVEFSESVVARKDVLVPFLDAIERDVIGIPKKEPLALELVDQYDALTRKPDTLGGREDLVRAVALVTWAIDLEGCTTSTGGKPGALNAY